MAGDIIAELGLEKLDDWETPNPTKPIPPMAFSIEKHECVQLLALSRMTLDQVSEHTGIPVSTIRRWKQHPDFISAMDRCVLDAAETMRAKRLMVLSKILDSRLEKAEERGDYSSLSNKDVLDIMDAIRKETEKDDKPEETAYMTTLTALIKATQEKQLAIPTTSTQETTTKE